MVASFRMRHVDKRSLPNVGLFWTHRRSHQFRFRWLLCPCFCHCCLTPCSLVFIIRFAERRIDQLLDSCILSYTPTPAELDAIQFESEWSFLRPFTGKRKAPPPSPVGRNGVPPSPTPSSPHRPLSPSQSQSTVSSSGSRGFSSLRQTITRARGQSSAPPLASIFPDAPPPPSPMDLTSFLTSLHMLLVLSDVNPSIITQLWSQVMYWTACKMFFFGVEAV